MQEREQEEKTVAAGLMEQRTSADAFCSVLEYRASNSGRSSREEKNDRRKQRFAKLMKRSEKSNESPGDKPDTLDALPIGRNHSQKFASYVDECSGRQVHYTKDGFLR
jgi:hypothetical protein